jgi:acyl carrier protein
MSDGVPLTQGRSEEEVRQLLRNLIFELAPGDVDPAGSDARLVEDLGYHSLALLEMAFTIEDEFDLEPIDDEAAQGIRTVRDVEEFVVGKLRDRVSGVSSMAE